MGISTGLALGPNSRTILAAGHEVYDLKRISENPKVYTVTTVHFNTVASQKRGFSIYPANNNPFRDGVNPLRLPRLLFAAHSYELRLHPAFDDEVLNGDAFPHNVSDVGLIVLNDPLEQVFNTGDPLQFEGPSIGIPYLRPVIFSSKASQVPRKVFVDGATSFGAPNYNEDSNKPIKRGIVELEGTQSGLYLDSYQHGSCGSDESKDACLDRLSASQGGDSGGVVYSSRPATKSDSSLAPIVVYGLVSAVTSWHPSGTCTWWGGFSYTFLKYNHLNLQKYFDEIGFCQGIKRFSINLAVVTNLFARVDGEAVWYDPKTGLSQSIRDWIIANQQ